MTFRSLSRLEKRGLLTCPVVGVAVDDWTLDQLVERARTSIEATGEELDEEVLGRFVERLSYVKGDFNDPDTHQRVGEAIAGVARGWHGRCSTSRSRPSCSDGSCTGCTRRG